MYLRHKLIVVKLKLYSCFYKSWMFLTQEIYDESKKKYLKHDVLFKE